MNFAIVMSICLADRQVGRLGAKMGYKSMMFSVLPSPGCDIQGAG